MFVLFLQKHLVRNQQKVLFQAPMIQTQPKQQSYLDVITAGIQTWYWHRDITKAEP
jgi:hypothetical protein